MNDYVEAFRYELDENREDHQPFGGGGVSDGGDDDDDGGGCADCGSKIVVGPVAMECRCRWCGYGGRSGGGGGILAVEFT